MGEHDFTSFAKKRTQVYTHLCTIEACSWKRIAGGWEFTIQGNRFLRGMVRALVGTMVKVGRGKITPNEFNQIKIAMNSGRTDFSAPAHGLFLDQVLFSESTSRFLL